MGRRDREASDLAAMVQRMYRALVRRAGEGDTAALVALADLQADASRHVVLAGQALMGTGHYTYTDLATELGITRQAARQRFVA
jgi:hypothetical protein